MKDFLMAIILFAACGAAQAKAHYVVLTWQSSGTQFHVYKSPLRKTPKWSLIATTAKPVYTDHGVGKGNTYQYVVTDVFNGQDSSFSNIITVQVPNP